MKWVFTVLMVGIYLSSFSQGHPSKGGEWQVRTEFPMGFGTYTQTMGLGVMASYFAPNDFGFNVGWSFVNTTAEYYLSYYNNGIISSNAFPITLGFVKRWAVNRSVIEPYCSVNFRRGADYGRSIESVLGAELNWTERLATYVACGIATQDPEIRFFMNSGLRYSFGFR